MSKDSQGREHGCGCDGGCDRRDFLTAMGAATGAAAFASLKARAADDPPPTPEKKQPARIRAAFLYPPSKAFAEDPNGWWSWPGNDFDAEGRQKQYTAALEKMQEKLGAEIITGDRSVASDADAEALAAELDANRPDGLLLVMFYNRSLKHADLLLKAAAERDIPVVFFIGLGVKHGSVAGYRREGVYFIQSLDNLEAIEYGIRMIAARKRISQSLLLSINGAAESRDMVEQSLGCTVRVVPFARYAKAFEQVTIDDVARALMDQVKQGAKEMRGITAESMENATRAHLALKRLLAEEQADGLTMNCLRRGMLKPCVSFAMLNGQLIPAACENDLPALYTQLLGQQLTGRPGFQHNPCFETERNHYYGSHCTCPSKLYGPGGPDLPYLLRRFAHTNEGSCAIQVFWKPGDPVTMARLYPGKAPALDVYAGRVVESHPMPPAAGCTTNVEIELTDRPDACMVRGHHNLLFCGDFARKFRLFAQLYKLKLVDTGFAGTWPV